MSSAKNSNLRSNVARADAKTAVSMPRVHSFSNSRKYRIDSFDKNRRTKYDDLLETFFETHQPAFIFEPFRKEFFWTAEPFDQEKISRLERILHGTSFFILSLFWHLRMLLAIAITVPIEIVHTLLAGLVKPILVRFPVIVGDTLIKPLYSAVFNGFILPFGICLWNSSDLLSRTLEPFVRLLNQVFEPFVECVRIVCNKKKSNVNDENQHGDGPPSNPNEDKRSIVYV